MSQMQGEETEKGYPGDHGYRGDPESQVCDGVYHVHLRSNDEIEGPP
jgi:hypothetical protein